MVARSARYVTLMCVRVVVITDIAAVSLCYKSCLILLLIINASSITVTTLRVCYFARDTVTGWTTQREKREKLESEAHYAALTSEVRGRKEAGRHSTEMFLNYRLQTMGFIVFYRNAMYIGSFNNKNQCLYSSYLESK